MKKRVKSLLLGVAAVVGFGAFATACIDSTSEHTHTYAETWEKDAEGHWNALTCECTDVVPEKKEHVDKNNDALCDICEYTDHEHTYAEDWTVDCTNHWHAADCGHIVAGADLDAHVDENADGECDVCKYVIEDIHEHYYATEWTTDEEYHWHAAVCEHKDQVADKAAHLLNAAGDCTVCGLHVKDVDAADVGAILAAAQANDYKIAFGDVIASEAVYGGTGAQTLENGKTNRVHFALGEGQSYIQFISFDMNGNYIGQEEQWYEQIGEDEVFGAAMLNGEYELAPIAGDAQFLNGYNYTPGSIIPSSTDDTSTLANMLIALYNQMKAGIRVSNEVEGYEEGSGKYVFAYTYYSVNAVTFAEGSDNAGGMSVELELYNVAVTFTVNDDMIIDQADFYVEVYRDYEADSDLSYEWTDLGNGVVQIDNLQLKPTANPTFYTYSVSQASGERTFTTPYPRSALIPTSFEFLYVLATGWNEDYTEQVVTESETIGDTLEVEEGTYAKFAIGDILPVTASTKFLKTEDFTYSFVNNDPNSTAIAWNANDTLLNGYSAYSGLLKLKLLEAGEYTVTIGFGGLTKTFTLIIKGEEAPDLGEDTANTINVATTDTYGYFDLYSYTATGEGTYTFNLPAGLGFQSKDASNPEVDFYDNTNGATVEVKLEKDETLEFYVGAITKDTWVITVDFVAGEVGGGDEGGDGNEGGNEGNDDYETVLAEGSNTVKFSQTEISTGSASRKLTVTADGNYKINSTSLFISSVKDADGNAITANKQIYDLTAGEYTVEFGMFGNLGVQANTAYTVSVAKQEEEPVVPPVVGGVDISGTYTATATNQDPATLTIDAEAGTIVFEYGTHTVNYTYTIENNVVTLYMKGSAITSGMAQYQGKLTLDSDGMPSAFQYNGYYYTLEVPGGEEEVFGTSENPYALELGTQELTISQTVVDSYYVHCTLEVTESGWYSFNGYWNCTGDNQMLENANGVCIYAEAGTTLNVSAYVDVVGAFTVSVAKENIIEMSAGNGDSAANGIAIEGEGVYGVSVNYDVCADGMYVNFTVTETGYYLITNSNFNNTVTYDGVTYSSNGDNGDLMLYAEVGTTYSLILDNVDFDDNWNVVEVSGISFLNVVKVPTLTVGENVVVGNGEENKNVVIVVETTGTYTISIEDKGAESIYLWGDDVSVDGYNPWGGASVYSTVVDLEAGVAYNVTVFFPSDENWVIMSGSWTVTITEGGEEDDTPVELIIDKNSINAADVTYVYTATVDGTLNLAAGGAVSGMVSISYTVNGGESTVLELSTNVDLALVAGDKVVITVEAEGYSTLTATWTTETDEGGEEGGEPTAVTVDIKAGENALTIAENTYLYAELYVIGTYTVTWDAAVTVEVNGAAIANGDMFTSSNSRYPVTLVIYAENYAAVSALNLTVAEYVEPAQQLQLGENEIAATAQGINAEFTADEAGTYTFTVGTNAVLVYGYDNKFAGEYYELTLAAGEKISFVVGTDDFTDSNVIITVSYGDDGGDGGDVVEPEVPTEPDGTKENPFIVTELPYTITLTDKLDVYVQYTVTEDCTLVITRTGGNVNDLPSNFENDLTAKTHTGKVTAGQVLLINFYAYSSKTYTISVLEEAELGSEANPYVIDALPYTFEATGSHDCYVTYTATEACTLQITYVAGNDITGLPSNFNKDAEALTYTGTVTAGEVLKLNLCGDAAGSYVFSVVVEETPGGGEGGDVNTGATAVKLVANGVYAASTVSSGNLALAASAETATVYYLEDAGSGLYHIYFLDGSTKMYLNCGISNSSLSVATEATTNWALDETNKHIVVDGATDWSGQNRVLVYDYASGTYVFRSKTTGTINNSSCYAAWYETV